MHQYQGGFNFLWHVFKNCHTHTCIQELTVNGSIPPGEVTAGCKLPLNWLIRLAVDLTTFVTCVA